MCTNPAISTQLQENKMLEINGHYVLNNYRKFSREILKSLLKIANSICEFYLHTSTHLLAVTTVLTRMWANAQPDGRPAEHRWRPLFNAAKFG